MQFGIEERFYGVLFVNTLPGLLLGGELLIAYELCTSHEVFKGIINFGNNVTELIAVLILAFFIATLLGVIIDGTRHYLYRDIGTEKDEDVLGVIKTTDQLNIYKFYTVSYWYPYEATGNVAIAMAPGIILIPIWAWGAVKDIWLTIVISVLFILVFLGMIQVSRQFLKRILAVEEQIFKSFSKS